MHSIKRKRERERGRERRERGRERWERGRESFLNWFFFRRVLLSRCCRWAPAYCYFRFSLLAKLSTIIKIKVLFSSSLELVVLLYFLHEMRGEWGKKESERKKLFKYKFSRQFFLTQKLFSPLFALAFLCSSPVVSYHKTFLLLSLCTNVSGDWGKRASEREGERERERERGRTRECEREIYIFVELSASAFRHQQWLAKKNGLKFLSYAWKAWTYSPIALLISFHFFFAFSGRARCSTAHRGGISFVPGSVIKKKSVISFRLSCHTSFVYLQEVSDERRKMKQNYNNLKLMIRWCSVMIEIFFLSFIESYIRI